jgi:hypothetical protein
MNLPDTFYHVLSRSRLGLFTHQEIGKVFGVGYSTITGALKHAGGHINSDKNIKKKAEGI